MLVVFAVCLRVLSNSTANLFQKKSAELSSSVLTNLWTYGIMSLLCVFPALFVAWNIYNINFWIYVIAAGMLCTLGTLALIEALRIGELSVLSPINSYKAVIGLISAIFIIGEYPSVNDFIAIIFMIIGSYFVLDSNNQKFSFNIFKRKDVLLRFFALLCSGVEAAFLKKIILMSSYKISLILWCFSGFICSAFIFFISQKNKNITLPANNLYNCFIISIMLLLMQLCTNFIFTKIEVGSALALFQLSALVSLYFGYKVFNEKNIRRKLAGTVIMIASACSIILG